jgi:hypothetical protein
VLAFRGAKQAVPALAIQGVSALQASHACGDLFANQVSEYPRMMTVQPQGKSFA